MHNSKTQFTVLNMNIFLVDFVYISHNKFILITIL